MDLVRLDQGRTSSRLKRFMGRVRRKWKGQEEEKKEEEKEKREKERRGKERKGKEENFSRETV